MEEKDKMTDENMDELKTRIKELEKELEQKNNDTSVSDLKTKYEEIIEEKNNEIQDLQNNLSETKKKVDETVDTLNDEIQQRLDANEEYQKALSTIKELEQTKAETTVDTYIQKGVILPRQRETAIKLCLNDPDTFSDLYRDAKPIVDTEPKRKSIPSGTAERIANYFKN